MIFPKWDAGSEDPKKYESFFKDSCTIVNVPDSNIDASATCEYTIGASRDEVLIRNAFAYGFEYPEASKIVFAIDNVRNAASLSGVHEIEIYTLDLNMNTYEYLTQVGFKP